MKNYRKKAIAVRTVYIVLPAVFFGVIAYLLSGPLPAFGIFWVVWALMYTLTEPAKARAEFEYKNDAPILNEEFKRKRDEMYKACAEESPVTAKNKFD